MEQRSQRDRLEQLQANVRDLERRRDETQARLKAARSAADEAEQRERAAALEPAPPLLAEDTVKRVATGAWRWTLITVLVVAAFAAVIGTVTVAIEHYRAEIRKRQAPE